MTFDVIDPNGPSVTAPASMALALNQSLAFTGTNAVSVTDPGASETSDSVRIGLTFGTLSLGTTSGLTFTNGSNNSNLMTVTGTLADLNAALSTLTYTAQNSFAGANPLYITVTNSVDNLTAADIVLMTVAPPVVTAPTSGSLNANGSLTFPGGSISVADPGAIYDFDGYAYESVTLSAANGTLALGSTNGLLDSFGSNNSSTISVTGTLANVNAALSGLVYTPNAGFAGSGAIQISFKDWFDGLIASASVSLAVTASGASPPSIAAPSSANLNENSSFNFASTISLTDTAATATSDSLSLSVTNGTLTLGSTTGIAFRSGANASPSMTITGTLANLNAAVAGLVYEPASGYSGSDSLQISLVDQLDTLSGSAAVAMSVKAPPTIAAPASAWLWENTALVFSAGTIAINDATAAGTSDSLSLSVSDGILLLGSTTGLTFTSGAAGTSSMTVTGTLGNLNAALSGLAYEPTFYYSGTDTLQLLVNDSNDNQSASTGVSINVAPAPVVYLSGGPHLSANTSFNFGADISVADLGASSPPDSLSLSVSHGILNLGTTAGVSFVSGSNGASSITISGTIANLNAAVNGLVYTPTSGYVGSDDLSVDLTDWPHNRQCAGGIPITVSGSPPTIAAPSTANLNENGSFNFASTISVTDSTASGTSDSLALSVNEGRLVLSSTAGLTFVSGSNGSSSMTVTGTLANLNADLNGLSYTPNSGYSGADSLDLALDNSLNSLTGSAAVSITVNAPPAVSAQASAIVQENSAYGFPGTLSFTDPAASGGSDSLTLSAANGTLTLGATGGITIASGSNGSSSMTITGTLANLNSSLYELVYRPNANFTGSDSLAITATNGNDGLTGSASVSLAVDAPPAIAAPGPLSIYQNIPYTFSNAFSVSDPTASGASDTVLVAVNDGTLNLGSTTGITVTAGYNGSSSINFSGTLANLNAALNGLVYSPSLPYYGADSLTILVRNSNNGLTARATVPITIIGNDAPVITAPFTASVNENNTYTFAGTASIADPYPLATTETLSLSALNGILTLGSTNGLTFRGNSVNNSSIMTVIGTLPNVNAALDGLVYTPTIGYHGTTQVGFVVTGTADNLTGLADLTVTVNPPVNPSVTAPPASNVGENGSINFQTAISVADPNATAGSDSVTLSAADGTLSLGTTTGVSISSGSNGSSSMTVSGSLANINAALGGLVYSPNSGYTGSDSLQISIDDTATGLSGSATVAISVSAPPKLTAPATASLKENSSYTFTNAISLTDANATGTSDAMTLSVAFGKLTLGSTAGLTFGSGSNTSSSMTVTGSLASLNAALSGLVYTPNSGFSGHDSLSISLADSIDKLTGAAAVAIAVNPIVTAPATAAVLENVPYTFSTAGNDPIFVTDGGASGTSDSLTLTVLHGKLNLGSLSGLTITSGANGSSSITVQGTLANLNAALNGLVYTPATSYTGSDTLTVTVNNASDGLSGSASVAISVAPRKIIVGVVMASAVVAPTDATTAGESDQWAGVSAAVDVLNS